MTAWNEVCTIRPATLRDVAPLIERYHAYAGVGASATACFAVEEPGRGIVAAFVWCPPPPGPASALCPDLPAAVLALSRMVAVPKEERRLQKLSRPLKAIMIHHLDRGRWPVLVTYSDEGLGHTGHVYRCSGWTPTARNLQPQYENGQGRRMSTYSNGRHSTEGLTRIGSAYLQRWEHRVCQPGDEAAWLASHGWQRVATGGVWRSGNPAHRWVKVEERAGESQMSLF